MSQFNGLLRKYIDIVNEAPELRTPAEIAASADLSSANDGSTTSGAAPAARNPNAGLTPDDPRWQGPKPAAAPNAAAVAGVTPKPQITPTAAPAAAAGSFDSFGAPVPAGSPAATTAGATNPTPAAAPAAATPAAAPAGPASPWAGKDPAKDAAWKALSPEDQKWLGGADPTDKFILARAPKKGAPAAAPAAPAAAATPAAAPAATPAPGAATGVNAQGQNVTMPNGVNPETGAPTVTTPGAPAQAAKPKVPAKSDPAVQKIQQDLIAKGAKIKADGVMGPATQAAMKQFGQGAKPAAPNTQGYNPATTNSSGMDMSQVSGESIESNDHVMYNEDQALARIIQLARG